MPHSLRPSMRFRLEHRHPQLPTTIVSVAVRLRNAAWELEDARSRLVAEGARGTLVIVLEIGGREFAVIERRIGLI